MSPRRVGADLKAGPYKAAKVYRVARGVLLLLLVSARAAAQEPALPWREAHEFLALFAPPGPRAGAYRALVTPLDLETVLKRLTADTTLLRPPGAWQPRMVLPADAFGQTGAYDRWALARLYGARGPRVARGPKAADGRVTESWALISPYPDATLQRLEPGTLLLVLRVP
jgi:hypothetical protein